MDEDARHGLCIGREKEGNVKMWVIITLISAVLIALLLAIYGLMLAALLGQVLDKFG